MRGVSPHTVKKRGLTPPLPAGRPGSGFLHDFDELLAAAGDFLETVLPAL
jgi:hypothetical protein